MISPAAAAYDVTLRLRRAFAAADVVLPPMRRCFAACRSQLTDFRRRRFLRQRMPQQVQPLRDDATRRDALPPPPRQRGCAARHAASAPSRTHAR